MKFNNICVALALVASFAYTTAQARPIPDAKSVLDKLAKQYTILGRYADVSMNVVREERQEVIHFEVFSADENRLRLEVGNPPRIKGSAIVRNSENLWVSMPRIDSVRHYTIKNTKNSSDQTVFGSDLRLSDLFGSFGSYANKMERKELLSDSEFMMILTSPDGLQRLTMELDAQDLPQVITVEEKIQGDKFMPVRRLRVSKWAGVDAARRPEYLVIEDLKKPTRYTQVEIMAWVGGKVFPDYMFEKPELKAKD